MGERHRPTITRTVADLGEGEGWVYQLRCTCPSLVLDTYHRSQAQDRRRYHLEVEADIDPTERCRDARHRVPAWDVCALCADQVPLFDL